MNLCHRLRATRALTLSYILITKASKRTSLLAFPWFIIGATQQSNKDCSPQGRLLWKRQEHRPN